MLPDLFEHAAHFFDDVGGKLPVLEHAAQKGEQLADFFCFTILDIIITHQIVPLDELLKMIRAQIIRFGYAERNGRFFSPGGKVVFGDLVREKHTGRLAAYPAETAAAADRVFDDRKEIAYREMAFRDSDQVELLAQ